MGLTNRKVLLVKMEVTYGTDPVPTPAANAVLVEGLAWSNAGLRMNERPAMRDSLGALQMVYGGSLFSANFTCEIKGSGAAGTAPEIGVLLQICGMLETVVPATNVDYTPASSAIPSATMYIYESDKLYKMTGCRGNVDFVLEAGAIGKANFQITGRLEGTNPTDVGMVAPTYDATVPKSCIAGAVTLGGVSHVVASITATLGNTVATPPDLSNVEGYANVQITNRNVEGSINPEDVTVAYDAWRTKLKAGTAQALLSGNIGSVPGNIFYVSFPKGYIRDLTPEDRDGVQAMAMPLGFAESTGDDEIQLTFL